MQANSLSNDGRARALSKSTPRRVHKCRPLGPHNWNGAPDLDKGRAGSIGVHHDLLGLDKVSCIAFCVEPVAMVVVRV